MQYQKSAITAALAVSLGIAPAVAQEGQDDEHHILEEIIVAATPLERTVEQLAQPASILTGDALTKKQATSIGETLASMPGMNSSYFGPIAARPVIRGQLGERVRVLSNGLDALDASALSEDHAVSLDTMLAERVEVIFGPATLLYGSGAAGGIVNIVDSRLPEEPLDTPFSGSLSLNGDTALGSRSGAASFDFGTDEFAAHFDYFRRDTDDIEIPGFAESARLRALEEAEEEEHEGEEHDEDHGEEEARGTVENSSSDTEGGAASFTLTGDDINVGLSVSRYDSFYGVPGHAHEHEHEEGESTEEEAEEEEEVINIDLEQIRYDLKASYDSEGIFTRTSLRVARNDYRHVELEGDEIGTRYDTDGTDARLELRHRPFGAFEGALGLQYKKVDLLAEGGEAFVPSSDTSQLSFFVWEEIALSDSWVLQGSARVERQEIETAVASNYSDTALGTAIGTVWSLPNDLALSANLSLTERHPNSTELYAEGPHIAARRYERGSVILGNGVLDKERSTNLDVTLRGENERFEWAVTGFINDVDDYVVLSPAGIELDELPVFDYGQTDAELYGAEAEVLFDIIETGEDHLHARLFGDFVHAEEKSSGEYLPYIPPTRWGLGLHYTGRQLDAAIEAEFNSEQSQVATNEIPTDSFTLVSAEVSYRLEESGVLVFLRGTNLGDEEARRHTSSLKDLVPLPGRSLHFGLRYDF